MSKRYTDTGLYDREWFQELPLKYKCFWEYICKKCNHAGIWDVNVRLASFCIGESVAREKILKAFNGKIIEIESDKWWIPKFVKFQYGLTLNIDNRVHKSVIAILEKYDLVDEEGNVKVPQGSKSPIVGKKKPKTSAVVKKFKSPTMEEAVEYFKKQKYINPVDEGQAFWRYYENNRWVTGRGRVKMTNWHLAAGNWNKNVKDRKPSGVKENKRVFIQQSHKDEGAGW
tara:strand:- start:1954 stop:2637 length:684 start_codon:yes stop_codon:yes gene_type:complete